VIIVASRWPIDGPSGHSGGEDAVNRRPINAGQPVHPVRAKPGRDGSRLSRSRVTMTHWLGICSASSGDSQL